jgi:hypothetical protein
MPRAPLTLFVLVFLLACSLVTAGFFDGHSPGF